MHMRKVDDKLTTLAFYNEITHAVYLFAQLEYKTQVCSLNAVDQSERFCYSKSTYIRRDRTL